MTTQVLLFDNFYEKDRHFNAPEYFSFSHFLATSSCFWNLRLKVN